MNTIYTGLNNINLNKTNSKNTKTPVVTNELMSNSFQIFRSRFYIHPNLIPRHSVIC